MGADGRGGRAALPPRNVRGHGRRCIGMAQANEITGGEAMARMLKAFNCGPMFGMGGFQLLAFYDAARRLRLDHHLINDERCGAFAADAYAKVSGRVGLIDATLGPGATKPDPRLVEELNSGPPVRAFLCAH